MVKRYNIGSRSSDELIKGLKEIRYHFDFLLKLKVDLMNCFPKPNISDTLNIKSSESALATEAHTSFSSALLTTDHVDKDAYEKNKAIEASLSCIRKLLDIFCKYEKVKKDKISIGNDDIVAEHYFDSPIDWYRAKDKTRKLYKESKYIKFQDLNKNYAHITSFEKQEKGWKIIKTIDYLTGIWTLFDMNRDFRENITPDIINY